jgi:hypothetical protein
LFVYLALIQISGTFRAVNLHIIVLCSLNILLFVANL